MQVMQQPMSLYLHCYHVSQNPQRCSAYWNADSNCNGHMLTQLYRENRILIF